MSSVLLFGSIAVPLAIAQGPPAAVETVPVCTVDLRQPGMMKDIVSNALLCGLNRSEPAVQAFLEGAEVRFATGHDLLLAAARQFDVEQATLGVEVEKYRHVNCSHGPLTTDPAAPAGVGSAGQTGNEATPVLSPFARDVLLHVVLHELGHALIREFDLPVLGNEETMADAFATHYLTTWMPDRAPAVLRARVASLMIEARAVPRADWPVRGEHDNDARRAFQIAALAVAADASRYAPVAAAVGMSEPDIRRARDYGAEIHRSWRRILAPLWMPGDAQSAEARVVCDPECGFSPQLVAAAVPAELESIARRFDWHSQVTIRFAGGAGGAGWSRGSRTVTVHGEYLRRFVEQGTIDGR